MKLANIPYYVQRVYALGPYKSAEVIYHKINRYFFVRHWRNQAYAHNAAHSWRAVSQAYGLSKNYIHAQELFKERLQKLLSLYPLFFNNYKPHNSCFVLGASIDTLNPYAMLLWHKDIRLEQKYSAAKIYFDQSTFYSDIPINQATQGWEEYKDIKLAWELSRLQFLIPQAVDCYMLKQQNATIIYQYLSSWYENNPFLLGVNWLCPMEVGLRVINIMWIISLCSNIHEIPCFIVQSIYDHMMYLESNWEWYDGKTSNHYLSNLVGYLYCCWFFGLPSSHKKVRWCFDAVHTEMIKQVFKEGTNYEGSTSYHKLVLELFHHALQVASLFGHTFSKEYQDRYSAMISFYYWCRYDGVNTIQIGDNDSGKVLTGIEHLLLPCVDSKETIKTFSQFGLSIIKTDTWHVSLRHYAYESTQPSGHFHHDAGSITLAYKGIPIVIDPGSYVYTASSQWRNLFRSAYYHSVCLLDDQDPIGTSKSLFYTPLKPAQALFAADASYILTTHDLYAHYNLRFYRSVSIEGNRLTIQDWWEPIDIHATVSEHNCTWYFMIDAELNIVPHDQNHYMLKTHDLRINIIMNEPSELKPIYVSYEYGTKKQSHAIKMSSRCVVHKKYATTFCIS